MRLFSIVRAPILDRVVADAAIVHRENIVEHRETVVEHRETVVEHRETVVKHRGTLKTS